MVRRVVGERPGVRSSYKDLAAKIYREDQLLEAMNKFCLQI